MNDALLLVDVINDFRHEDGEKLLAAFRERHAGLVAAVAIDGRELGFKITVLRDACASPDERLEQVALAYLEEVVGARLQSGVALP